MLQKHDKDALFFLQSLKEDGVQEIHISLTQPAMDPQIRPVEHPAEPIVASSPRDQLLSLRSEVLKCTKCGELAQTRKNVVFGAGNIKAKLMFVGEAPGRDEDEQGLPFVGMAGQLLTKIIESIGLSRKEVFIANVLKCRPPDNRQPEPNEVMNCQGYLMTQIRLTQPRIICCLGTFAAQSILNSQDTISHLRGRFFDRHDSKVICTYHPAYLLRNPAEKRKVWDDMKQIKALLDQAP